MIRSFKGMKPAIPASCYVDESAQIIGDVVLGEHASVWMNAVLRGDVYAIRVGAHSNVQDNSVLHGMKNQYGVTLGEYVTVGHSVTLHGCTIEDRCLIGMGSIILNGARVGAGSMIVRSGIRVPAAIIDPAPIFAPFKMIDPMPIRQRSSMVHPCSVTECPTVTYSPRVTPY